MSRAPRAVIREVVDPADPAIVAAHRVLLRTFARDEAVDRREWRDTLLERQADVWSDYRWHLLVAELGGKVVGMASGTYLGNVNTGVIGYVTVDNAARGLGLGPRLRARLRTLFQRDARQLGPGPLAAIIGEVSRDNPWLRALARRDGVLALDFDYLQPSLREGDRPVSLVLYYEPLLQPMRRVPTALLRKLLFTMWRRVYRIGRPMSHRTFHRMLSQLEGRRSIGKLTALQLARLAARSGRAEA